jgi:predicted dehydrogenase
LTTRDNSGKDILGEKPLALSTQDAQLALQKVADAEVRLQVGFSLARLPTAAFVAR